MARMGLAVGALGSALEYHRPVKGIKHVVCGSVLTPNSSYNILLTTKQQNGFRATWRLGPSLYKILNMHFMDENRFLSPRMSNIVSPGCVWGPFPAALPHVSPP